MLEVYRQPLAVRDLLEIWGYIAEDSEMRADAFIDKIEDIFITLAKSPKVGRLRNDLSDGLRSFPIGNYAIFYLPIASKIIIVRVLHSARDIDSEFFN